MLFLGDIASPNAQCSADFLTSLKKYPHIFQNNCTVANLEGLFLDGTVPGNKPILYNHPSILEPLHYLNTKAVSLANNHTLDIPELFPDSKKMLDENGIGHSGAGVTVAEADTPAEFEYQGQKFLVFAFGWHILMQHQDNRPGHLYVSTIRPHRILELVKKAKKEQPDAKIIVKIHWSFDLETLPFPLYRQFSRAMIDAGVNAVVGCHSHCVQGGERYKDGLIIYGLGNFFMPWFTFINGTLELPDFSRMELAVEWDHKTGDATAHFFKYTHKKGDAHHELEHVTSESFTDGKTIESYSPYRNMSLEEYIPYYKAKRRKGFLMPTYKDYRQDLRNSVIDNVIIYRIKVARFLAERKLREWNN
jgi:hypothetical protein